MGQPNSVSGVVLGAEAGGSGEPAKRGRHGPAVAIEPLPWRELSRAECLWLAAATYRGWLARQSAGKP